jgi:hypothetical protein
VLNYVLHYEGILGSGGIGPCILNLRNKWGEGELHA